MVNEIVFHIASFCALGLIGMCMFAIAGILFVTARMFLKEHPYMPVWIAGFIWLGWALVAGLLYLAVAAFLQLPVAIKGAEKKEMPEGGQESRWLKQ